MNGAQAVVFALGLALSTATQLRIAGPIGPGECLLALWLLLVLLNQTLYSGVLAGAGWLSSRVAVIWALLLGAISVGIVLAQWMGLSGEANGTRDLLALGFTAALSIMLSAVKAEDGAWKRLLGAYLVALTLSLMILLPMALARISIAIDPWFAEIRFRGWSENPNQTALMLIALPYLAAWLYPRVESRAGRASMAACVAVSLIAGLLSLSEALYGAWLCSFALCAAMLAVRYYREPVASPLRAIWKMITFPTLLGGAALALLIPLAFRAVELVAAIYELGDQGQIRLAVWQHGLEAASRSPLFGLGPGAFSGVQQPFQNYEAHNTFIDVLTQAGLLGLIAYVLLLVFLGQRFLASREIPFIGAFVALVLYSCFHYVLRQPSFWLTLVLMARLVPLSLRLPLPAKRKRPRMHAVGGA